MGQLDPNIEENWFILSVFINEMDTCLGSLNKAIKQEDLITARANLHQMIGATRVANDHKLESTISILQDLVKNHFEQKKAFSLLSEIQSQLDYRFESMVKSRSTYHLHFLSPYKTTWQFTQHLLEKKDGFKQSKSESIEDCLSYLSLNQVDLLMVDYTGDIELIRHLKKHLSSASIITPVLLLVDNNKLITQKEKTSSEINGFLEKPADSADWLKAIQTVTNGRFYEKNSLIN